MGRTPEKRAVAVAAVNVLGQVGNIIGGWPKRFLANSLSTLLLPGGRRAPLSIGFHSDDGHGSHCLYQCYWSEALPHPFKQKAV